MRVIDAHHEACGAATRVRLPGALSARAVRRFHCAGCASAFEAAHIEEIEMRIARGGEVAVDASDPASPYTSSAPTATPPPEPVEKAQPLAMEDRAVEALTRAPKRKVAAPKVRLPKPRLSVPKFSVPKLPAIRLPKIEPDSRTWKLASIGIAAVLVVAILFVVNGGDDPQVPPAPAPQAETDAGTVAPAGGADEPAGDARGSNASKGSKKTKFVSEGSFSLALPKGWERIDPPAGATFAAVAADGGADATLWITQDPKLDFPTFINQSLEQLKTLAPSARVTERVPAPTPEGTVVTLGADAPSGQPTYEATLRVAGPYRYYLATTIQPDATPQTADDVELITGSLTPELGG